MLENIKILLQEKEDVPAVFKRNLIKEYLQILTLSFLYSHKEYQKLIFYGGSALRHCYGLLRLSEDMDFVDVEKRIDLGKLSRDIINFYKSKHGIDIITKVQKFRCTLKFPILHILNLVNPHESNLLFTKIEVYKEFGFCKKYNVEIKPLFKFGEALLIKTFDLSTLMATKIRAIMLRKWERTTQNGKILAEVKGRDYFDLMWYLEQKVRPNLECIEGIKNEQELYDKLLKIVKSLNPQSIKYDLEGLIEDSNFVNALAGNIKQILISLLMR